MELNYILASTVKEATSNALKVVAKRAETDVFGSYILLVPETKSIIIERELLKLSSRGSFANVFVYSFVRLLEHIGKVPREKVLSKQACVLLLKKIIYENYDKLTCYKKTAKNPNFAEKIYDTIQQIKSSDISKEELLKLKNTRNKALLSKLEDIIFIKNEYDKFLSDGFYDDCDRLSLLSEVAKENNFLKQSNVFVVGFDNITPEMKRCLKALAKTVKQINFSCVYLNGREGSRFSGANELFEKYTRIADELSYPYNPSVAKSRFSGDFFQISKNLFSAKNSKVKSQGQVKVFKAPSKKKEIDFVANAILNAVENGKRFNEIGVMLSDISDLKLVEECFEVYNIPYFANVSEPVADNILVSFVQSTFETISNGAKSESVVKLLSNPLFGAKNFALVKKFIVETGAEKTDFFGTKPEEYAKNLEKYYSKLSELSETKIDELNLFMQDINSLKNFYKTFSKLIKQAKVAGDFVQIIRLLFENFSVQEMLEKFSLKLRKNGFLVQAEIYSQIFSKYLKLLDEFEFFLANSAMPQSEFLAILKTGLTEIKINIAPLSSDAVIIQENTDGFFGLKEMFIVGAVQGRFPCSIYDSGILETNELEEANTILSSPIEPSVKDINARESFRVFQTLLEPKEKLYVTYSEHSQDGKLEVPARLVVKLTELFGDAIVLNENYRLGNTISREILERRFAGCVSDFYDNKRNLSDVNNFYFSNEDRFSEEFKNYIANMVVKNTNFDVKSVKDLVFLNGMTSVTQLQTYFDCPYKFFTKYALRLKEPKSAEIKAMEIGTIIHSFAEIFTKNIEDFKSVSLETFSDKVKKIVHGVLKEAGINFKKNVAIISMLIDECERLGRHILFEQENSSFKITQQEYVFKDKDAIKLNLNDGKVLRIEGKIDRIDTYLNYVRVVDYKTGKDVSAELDSIYVGKKIQLPSYFEAIELQGKQLAGVFYLPIHSGFSENDIDDRYKMSGFLLDDADITKHMDERLGQSILKSDLVPVKVKIDKNTGILSYSGRLTGTFSNKEFLDIKNYVHKLMKQAAEEILQGYIEPSPLEMNREIEEEPHSCTYCKCRGFCGLQSATHPNGRKFVSKVTIQNFEVQE